MKFFNVQPAETNFSARSDTWLQFGPFEKWLVGAQRPKRIVQLGSYYGFPYFCFCQAVLEANIEAECYAVDRWQGGKNNDVTSDDVFEQMLERNRPYVGFSKLLRKSSIEALDDIADGSVDLLHFGCCQFNQDVKATFESWTAKLSSRAVVLFQGMGVGEQEEVTSRCCEEISAKRPSFNLTQQNTLGVMFWGEEIAGELAPLLRSLNEIGGRDKAVNSSALADESHAKHACRRIALSGCEYILRESCGLQNEPCQELKRFQIERELLQCETANKLSIVTKAKEFDVEILESFLRDARNKPLKQLRNKMAFGLLNLLAGVSAPLSRRRSARFKRSAAKRDPMRTELRPWRKAETPYEQVLSEWRTQRLKLSSDLDKLALCLKDGPLISVAVSICDPELSRLVEFIESILKQSYSNWELCLAVDRSVDTKITRIIQDYSDRDERVRILLCKEECCISELLNSAVDCADGKYISFLGQNDLLDPDALLFSAQVIDCNPEVKIIYADEDLIGEDGKRFSPNFKPDWNAELLYGMNYIGNFGVYDVDLVRKVGAFHSRFKYAQQYDLLLRCIEHVEDNQIRHIAKVLYSCRDTSQISVVSGRSSPLASEDGRRALEEHVKRISGKYMLVVNGVFPFSYRVLWPIEGNPHVSIIIPTRDHLDVLHVAVESILEKTTYRNFELIIVDNQSVESETLVWLERIQQLDSRVRVVRDERPFNYSALNNSAVAQSRGEIVALVNNDIEVISPDWLSEMVSLVQRPKTGCVGAKLLYPSGRLQHAGVVIGMGGIAGHGHQFFPFDHPGYFGRLAVRQSYSAVTAACLVVRRETYDRVGGLNETDLAVAFNDVDFCLKVREAGYNNIWTPYAELYHHESISRGLESTPEKRERFQREVEYMKKRWRAERFLDPAYNPNLTLESTGFVMGDPSWSIGEMVGTG